MEENTIVAIVAAIAVAQGIQKIQNNLFPRGLESEILQIAKSVDR